MPEEIVLRDAQQVKGDDAVELGGSGGKGEDKLVEGLLRLTAQCVCV